MQAQLIAMAQRAAPSECCGWVTAQTVRIADNVASSNAQFEFAAPDLLALARASELPATHADRPIAIFHSHPTGPAELSAADLACAVLRVAKQPPQPSYTAHQLLVVGPAWRVLHFEFDPTAATLFHCRGLGS
ncbi:MAG: Mov34/MPN/PAD-1 family protein [Kofleriaceae bacterium]|nr:Mov34/MPN/PAD-1 family protein [Kofleriaceae bacterium]